MSGDYSRKSFDALRDFAGVFLQQGHAILDSDWNELVALFERRLRAETVDVIGRAVVPRETPLGFQIAASVADGEQRLSIGRGRMYVDGLLAENHGAANWPGELEDATLEAPVLDRTRLGIDGETGVLDELISRAGGDFVDYARQPYDPDPAPLPEAAGPHLVYLDVWKREVTPLKDPRLLDPALGGLATTTRWQTVWQVRVLPDVGNGVTCATPDAEIPGWMALKAPSAGRLTSDTIEIEDPDEPCLIPPEGGYRGLENQLYRIEIHQGGDLAQARFKWSRENASIGASVEAIQADDRIVVRRIGRDSLLRFSIGDWVEITDDIRELHGLPGDLVRVNDVNDDTRVVVLSAPLSADLIPSNGDEDDTLASRHTRLIRWEQRGEVRLGDGTVLVNLDDDTSDGLIPIPAAGTQIVLEAGIVVSFSLEPAGGNLRAMDYWCFAARTAGAQIEKLDNAPPRGVHHHLARLAVVSIPDTVADCRVFWPPEFTAGNSCACSVCVTAERHNSGELTIHNAVSQVVQTGGTICLGVGTYLLGNTPVTIDGGQSVRLLGQGSRTILAYAGSDAAVSVRGSSDVRIEDLAIVSSPLAIAAPAGPLAGAAVHLRNCLGVALRRIGALVFAPGQQGGLGVALDGYVLGLKLEESVLIAPVAVGAQARPETDQGPGYLLLAEARVLDNVLFAQRRAVSLDGLTLHIGATRIEANLVMGGSEGGIIATGASAPAATVAVEGNTITLAGPGNGVEVGAPIVRVQDNDFAATGEASGNAIAVVEGLIPDATLDVQLIGNRVQDAGAFGILVDASVATLMIKRNVLRRCGQGGIVIAPDSAVASLALDNNVIEETASGLDTEASVAAIRLAQVGEALVAGNTVRGVGSQATRSRYWAGIDIAGVAAAIVCGNSFSDIGPAEAARAAIAIRVEGPLFTLDVSGNLVAGGSANTNLPWSGLMIRSGIGEQRGADAFTAFPAHFSDGRSVFALSHARLRAVGAVRADALTVQDNQLSDAHAGALPLVDIVGQDNPATTCVFTGNQCHLTAERGAASIVSIAAPRVIAANNIVRRPSDQDAMHLFVGSDGVATVIGNLTFGNIRLEPHGIPPAMAPLNLLAH